MKRIARAAMCVLLLGLFFLGCRSALAQSPPSKVTLPKKQTVLLGRALQLTPQVKPSGASATFTWLSSDPGVASVHDGLVRGISTGKARITAETPNGLKASCMITVSPVPIQSFSLQARETSGRDEREGEAFILLTGHKLQCSVESILPGDAAQDIVWKLTKPSVAQVDQNGLITAKKAGTCLVRATSRYGKASRSLTIKAVANQSPLYQFPYPSAPRPTPGGGVKPISRRIYLKNDHLMIDMYMYNADTSAIRGQYRMSVFLSYTPELDLTKYLYMGDFTVRLKNAVRPGKVGVVAVDLGQIEADKAVLLGAIAFGQEPFTAKRADQSARRMIADILSNFSEQG